MLYFRLNQIHILDNQSLPAFGFFGPDRADLQFISLVNSDVSRNFDWEDFALANGVGERRSVVRASVNRQLDSMVTPVIRNVRDGQRIVFGDSGKLLFHTAKQVEYIDWQMMVVKSNRDVREFGAGMEAIFGGPELDTLTASLITTAGATNPGYVASAAVAKFALQAIAKRFVNTGDKIVGVFSQSLVRVSDFPHLHRDTIGSVDLTGNMAADYTIFGTGE